MGTKTGLEFQKRWFRDVWEVYYDRTFTGLIVKDVTGYSVELGSRQYGESFLQAGGFQTLESAGTHLVKKANALAAEWRKP